MFLFYYPCQSGQDNVTKVTNICKKSFYTVFKKTILTGNRDKRSNDFDDVRARTDEKLINRTAKFTNVIKGEKNIELL